ncbi:MAG: hypothetical protein ACPGVU_03175 [Limisphaerales bacterium]
MASQNLKFKLAKVLIAAAWADGRLENEELNTLKDFLFGIPDIGQEDWQRLMTYLESPIGPDESRLLLDDLLAEVKGRKDRAIVSEMLDKLVASDGVVSPSEQAFVDEVMTEVNARGGLFRGLKNRMKSLLGSRSHSPSTAREEQVEDFVNNEVFHYLVHVKGNEGTVRLPEEEVRRMCLSAGLMAWVLHSDLIIDEEDRAAVEGALIDQWHVSKPEAAAVAEAACERAMKGIDFNRLCRTHFEIADPAESLALVKQISKMAHAATNGRPKKLEGVQAVAERLKLPAAVL